MGAENRTVSFSDIATFARWILGFKDPVFDPQAIKDGNLVHAYIKGELVNGRGPEQIRSLSSQTPKFEQRYKYQLSPEVQLTARPDIVYEDPRSGLQVVEIKRRKNPSVLDVIQGLIALFVIRQAYDYPEVTVRVYYDGSGKVLTLNEGVLESPQAREIIEIAKAADIIKQGEEERKKRPKRQWGRRQEIERGGIEEAATKVYPDFAKTVQKTANRGGLIISNQFPDDSYYLTGSEE